MYWRVPVVTGLLLGSSAAIANNCEAIREQVEAKILASGVSRFAVTVVDASAKAEGKVVGTCDRGSKKLVYKQFSSAAPGSPASAAAAAPAGKSKSRSESILTECKDGSVSYGGNCKK